MKVANHSDFPGSKKYSKDTRPAFRDLDPGAVCIVGLLGIG